MRKALIIAVAGLAIAGVAFAQAQNPQQQPQQQQRANQQEKMIEGTVVSADSQLLVIRSDQGQMRLTINASSQNAENLRSGDRVQVWFRPADQTAVTTGDAGDGVVVRVVKQDEQGVQAQTRRDDTRFRDDAQQQERDRYGAQAQRDQLPRTASDMPLIGLLGALAVAGAIGLRVVSRQLF